MVRGRLRSLRPLAARAAPFALVGAIVLGAAALLVAGDGSTGSGARREDHARSATRAALRVDAAAPPARADGGTQEPSVATRRHAGAPAAPAAGAPPADGADAAAARIAALRDAARRAPRDGEVRRALGVELVEQGDVDEGARLLVEASRLLGRDALEEHGVPMLRLLHANAREEEEAQVRERIEELGL